MKDAKLEIFHRLGGRGVRLVRPDLFSRCHNHRRVSSAVVDIFHLLTTQFAADVLLASCRWASRGNASLVRLARRQSQTQLTAKLVPVASIVQLHLVSFFAQSARQRRLMRSSVRVVS